MFYIRGRRKWDAPPLEETPTPQDPSTVHTLVVHHTAGIAPLARSVPAELRSIDAQHRNQGWIGIGYNVLIDRQGRAWEGRGLFVVGAHTKLHNTETIGVSFLGNYENIKPNRRQLVAFNLLKARLRMRGFRFTVIKGHKQMPGQATACPGKYLMEGLGL